MGGAGARMGTAPPCRKCAHRTAQARRRADPGTHPCRRGSCALLRWGRAGTGRHGTPATAHECVAQMQERYTHTHLVASMPAARQWLVALLGASPCRRGAALQARVAPAGARLLTGLSTGGAGACKERASSGPVARRAVAGRTWMARQRTRVLAALQRATASLGAAVALHAAPPHLHLLPTVASTAHQLRTRRTGACAPHAWAAGRQRARERGAHLRGTVMCSGAHRARRPSQSARGSTPRRTCGGAARGHPAGQPHARNSNGSVGGWRPH